MRIFLAIYAFKIFQKFWNLMVLHSLYSPKESIGTKHRKFNYFSPQSNLKKWPNSLINFSQLIKHTLLHVAAKNHKYQFVSIFT